MSKPLLLVIAFLLLPYFVQGQSTFGLNLNGFIPTGELKDDSPEIWGGGLSLDAAFKMKDSPVHLGGVLGYTLYGSEVRKGWHGPGLEDVRVRRNNHLTYMLGLVRLKPEVSQNVQPYVDFVGGFSFIFTSAHFRDRVLEEPWDTVVDLSDFVMNYGFGGGLEVFLDDYLSLDFNVKLIKSSRANYLTPASVTYNTTDDVYEFDIQKSRFNHLNFGVGIKFLISEW